MKEKHMEDRYYEKTCLFDIIQDKIREDFQSTAILIIKQKNAENYTSILSKFAGIEPKIKKDLANEGFALVKIGDADKAKQFFSTLQQSYNKEPLSFILMDKDGEIIDFFPQETLKKMN
jgi:hypothetical protein